MPSQVIVTYLEMSSPTQLRSKRLPDAATLRKVEPIDPAVNEFFYKAVGADFDWTDRLTWTIEQWRDYVSQPGVETWVLSVNDERAGYFELSPEAYGAVDIRYFGLLPGFTGSGLGGGLLTAAVERAWAIGAKRVTVNTCTLDHPSALANYLARGFSIVETRKK